VIAGLAIGIVRVSYFLFTHYVPLFTNGTWELLTTPGSEPYHPLWGPLLVFEIIGNLGAIALSALTLWQFTKKSRLAVKLAIATFAWSAVFVTTDFFVADLIPAIAAEDDASSRSELTRTLVGAVIWIPYFLLSKRVKNTFVN